MDFYEVKRKLTHTIGYKLISEGIRTNKVHFLLAPAYLRGVSYRSGGTRAKVNP